jgi:two-component system, response regulator YesN
LTVKGDSILVVEDNAKLASSVTLALEGYHVQSISSGEDALEILSKPHHIDLVILDVNIRGASGTDLLAEIKKSCPNLSVIILTSYESTEILSKSLKEGASDFLDKPFRQDELREKVDNLIEHGGSGREHSRGGLDSAVQRVRRFIEKNHDRRVSLKDAASITSLSTKYLSKMFKQKTGKKFTEYRLSIRMDVAKKLLEFSDKSVGQIALKLGYENAESFMKMFKKIFGLTPTEYRRHRLATQGKTSEGASGGSAPAQVSEVSS